MSWMQYGASHYELGSTEMVGITPRDVANSLAKLNRYIGHTIEPYSVGYHSLIVSRLCEIHGPVVALYGLLHDVAETVVGDLSYPMKQALGFEGLHQFRAIEHAAEKALFKVLGVHWPVPPDIAKLVKDQDWVAAATEKRDLLPPCDRSWDMLPYDPAFGRIMPSTNWKHIADTWLKRFIELHAIACQVPVAAQQQAALPPPSKDANGNEDDGV